MPSARAGGRISNGPIIAARPAIAAAIQRNQHRMRPFERRQRTDPDQQRQAERHGP